MNGTSAADLSAMPNQFLSNTPLMQDPTAQAPQNPLLPPTAGIVPIAQQAPGEAASVAATTEAADPDALRNKALAEAEAATQQEAAAYGAQARDIKAAAGQLETDVTAAKVEGVSDIDRGIEILNQEQARRDQLSENQAKLAEQKAAALQTDEQKLDDYVAHTPTRQAAAAAAMHLAAPLSILAALGGAFTRQSGIAMMGALNGVVEGIQEGSDNKFNDAMDHWQKAYDQLKHHQETTQQVYDGYLKAYGIRTDAVDKAAEHTMTVMNEQAQKHQLQVGAAKDIFNAKDKAIDATMKYGVALAKIREQRAARLETEGAYSQQIIDLKAGQLLDGMDSNKVFAGMRGIKGLPFQNAVWAKAEQMWFQRPENSFENHPEWGGSQEVRAQAAAEWLDNAQRRAKAGENALRVAAAAAGKVTLADKLLVQSLPLAQQAMVEYQKHWGANHSFIPYNQMAQHIKEVTGDPYLRSLQLAIRHTIQDYSALGAGRIGTSALADRIENERLLMAADSPKAFFEALRRMEIESQAMRRGSEEAMDPRTFGLGVGTSPPGKDEQSVLTPRSSW